MGNKEISVEVSVICSRSLVISSNLSKAPVEESLHVFLIPFNKSLCLPTTGFPRATCPDLALSYVAPI
jgi:hypothetical protein